MITPGMLPGTPNRRMHERQLVMEVARLLRESGKPIAGVLTDVSLGGVQIKVREALFVGEKLVLSLGRDGEPPLEVNATVRYSLEIEDTGSYASGLEFMPESDQKCLEIGKYVRKTVDRYVRSLARPVLHIREAQ